MTAAQVYPGRLLTAFMVVALAAAVLITASSDSASGASAPAVDKAEALAASPDLFSSPAGTYGPDEARAAAERALDHVPLPPGGNLERIDWDMLGGGTPRDVEVFAEHNAFCQWLVAAHEGHDRATALAVLGHVPSWPAFRSIGDYDYQAVVAQARAGAGPALEHKLAECRTR